MNENINILVLDDEDAIRMALRGHLELYGYRVFDCATLEEAFDILGTQRLDIIISDINLKGSSGKSLLTFVKKNHPQISVIMITGAPDIQDVIEIMKQGADDYVLKPFEIENILDTIKKSLNKKEKQQPNDLTIITSQFDISRTLEDYEIESLLGEGNMGIVYRVKKIGGKDGKTYALKLLKYKDKIKGHNLDREQRFMHEAKAMSNVKHPHIVEIVEFVESRNNNPPFIVMEYVAGKPLKHYISHRELNYQQNALLIRQITDALSAIHEQGICHRDLKPDNIIVMDGFNAKIMDFGIARIPDSELTMTTDLMGTPYYFSPEALQTSRVDARSDIFSLGILSYELFLGVRPFNESSIFLLGNAIASKKPIEPRKIDPQLPEALQFILAGMMRKHPDMRFKSAAEIVGLLTQFIESGELDYSPYNIAMFDTHECWS